MPSAVLKITPEFALLMRLFVHFGDASFKSFAFKSFGLYMLTEELYSSVLNLDCRPAHRAEGSGAVLLIS